MIAPAQLYQAINEYIDTNVMKLCPTQGAMAQLGFGVKVGIIKRVIPSKLDTILADPALKELSIISDKNELDEKLLYEVFTEQFDRMKEIHIAGFTLKQNDLDDLYKVVKKYAQTTQNIETNK